VITEAKFQGRSREFFTTGSQLQWGYRTFLISATVAGNIFTLPDARSVPKGYVVLVGGIGANSFVVKDSAGNTLEASHAQFSWTWFTLRDNSTQAGTWILDSRTRLT